MPIQPGPVTGPKMTHVDRLEVSETYADSLLSLLFDGVSFKFEFVVNRMDVPPKPGQVPTGRRVTCCRLVLPPGALIDMANQIDQVLNHLKAKGVVKELTPGQQGHA